MRRSPFTWVIGGGIATLVFYAGLDAPRSAGDEEVTAPQAAATTSELFLDSVPPCRQQDLRVWIEVRDGVATVVARNSGEGACVRLLERWRLAIEDRAGNVLAEWLAVENPLRGTYFPSGSERDFWVPQSSVLCASPGPFRARAASGPYSVSLGSLNRDQVACSDGDLRTPDSRLVRRFMDRARAICNTASHRLRDFQIAYQGEWHAAEISRWNRRAARFSEQALVKLRALAPLEVSSRQVAALLETMERQTSLLRRIATVTAAGDRRRAKVLETERVRLTRKKDRLATRLAAFSSGVSPESLYGCPVGLGASP
jgi:hypothetical protein